MAGDIGSLEVVDKLKEFAKLKAVYGNIDNTIIRSEFPEMIYYKCEDINVLMTHIGGYPGNYNKKILNFCKSGQIKSGFHPNTHRGAEEANGPKATILFNEQDD